MNITNKETTVSNGKKIKNNSNNPRNSDTGYIYFYDSPKDFE